MSIRKIVSFITGCTVAAGAFASAAVLNEAQAESSDNACKIMCVGDSITHGYINGDNGYRKYLCYYLQEKNISYDMVGAENNWTDSVSYNWNGTEIKYDPAHCGYSGYAIQQYNGRSGIYETLFGGYNAVEKYDPDIVLLQIGTNDLLDARLDVVQNTGDVTSQKPALERLENLVDTILTNLDSDDALFLASVPDIDAYVRADWLSSYGYILGVDTSSPDALMAKVQECVDRYNQGVKALAEKKASEGRKVYFADINSVVDIKSGLYDGVHPNEDGYSKMGKLWADTLEAYLSGGNTPSSTTSETTTTTTTTTTEETTTTTITTTTTEETTTTTETTTSTEETTTTTETTTATEETTTTTETTTATEETTTTTTTETTFVPMPAIIKGDVDRDGVVTMLDAVLLRKYIAASVSRSEISPENCDMDENGRINIFDAVMLLEKLVK